MLKQLLNAQGMPLASCDLSRCETILLVVPVLPLPYIPLLDSGEVEGHLAVSVSLLIQVAGVSPDERGHVVAYRGDR